MADSDYARLAHAHMARQVQEAAALQAGLAAYWDRHVDPSDFAGSFARFREASLPLIIAGRNRSEVTADNYYRDLKLAAGYATLESVPRQPAEVARLRAALEASAKVDHRARRIRAGEDPAKHAADARRAMLRSAKRQVLGAGRQRLIGLSAKDRDIGGWARVSDGRPCGFCGMLVSRGPVYTESSVHFPAHDGCGCSVRLVPRNDPTGGWSNDARDMQEAWREWSADTGGDRVSWATYLKRRQTKMTGTTGGADALLRGGAPSVPRAARADANPRGASGASSDLLGRRSDRHGDSARRLDDLPRTDILRARGASTPPLYELPASSAESFADALKASADSTPFGSAVYVYDLEDYRKMRMFATEDGMAGFAVKDGEIVSVFSNANGPHRGVVPHLLSHAVEEGGRQLDAFDTVLPDIYAKAGFQPTARLAWNDEYAPDGWDYETFGRWNGGRPDVVFMRYDPNSVDWRYEPGSGAVVTDYDAGLASAAT